MAHTISFFLTFLLSHAVKVFGDLWGKVTFVLDVGTINLNSIGMENNIDESPVVETCASCGAKLKGDYCRKCGEKKIIPERAPY